MINFERFTLSNGLKVLVHEDASTPMAVLDVIYDVGARDEDENKTGFAHLFEHLMFGGSVNIPDYDEPLQMAGGENNAFTTTDMTNYYCKLPAQNIETAFWLESDRMLSLAFSEKSLDVQRKVVCEEFKEHYINKPYGDAWHMIKPMCYTTHPYQWLTIGKQLSHIEEAQLQDVKNFFFKHYTPCNAILVVAGNVTVNHVKQLAQKWFEPIPSGVKYVRNLPAEPKQTAARLVEHKAKVPADSLYKNWHIGGRLDDSYYAMDLITEVLGGGSSSRLYQTLVKEEKLFTNISCYHHGSFDPGLLSISGKISTGIDIKKADERLEQLINEFCQKSIEDKELEKVKNKSEAILAFEDMNVMSRATNIAIYELLGRAELMNEELDNFRQVTTTEIIETAKNIFTNNNCSTLYYVKQ